MLELRDVTAGYGQTTVLRDVDFRVAGGQTVALFGPNGAGKTTLLRTASGFVRPSSGQVFMDGENVTGKRAFRLVGRGVSHLPEGRGIFPSLTVKENLMIFGRSRRIDEVLAEVGSLFPILAERRNQSAGSLSGGEQQMLALSRAYLAHPKVVLVDEASLGLAPKAVEVIYEALGQLVRLGLSLVVVEQYVHKALEIADIVYVLNRGSVQHVGRAEEIDADEIYQSYLGVR